MEAKVANNGYVSFQLVGSDTKSIICHTDKTDCCATSGREALGNWFYPNGSVVLSHSEFQHRSGSGHDHPFFARNRGQGIVRLYRPMHPSLHESERALGRFHCVVPDQENNNQTIYINICKYTMYLAIAAACHCHVTSRPPPPPGHIRCDRSSPGHLVSP